MENTNYLYFFLLFIPILGITYLLLKKIWVFPKRMGNIPALSTRITSFLLIFSAFSCLILALCDPFIYVKSKSIKYNDVNIFLLVDVSKSMVYAEDISPNRLEACKKQLLTFINTFDDCPIGIIPFSGVANTHYCYPSRDKKLLVDYINLLSTDVCPSPGTDLFNPLISVGIIINKEKLNKHNNIVILLSDGGKEESISLNRDKLSEQITKLKKDNCTIYTVGVGSNDKVPLIIRNNGKILGYVKEDNKISYSQLDEDILKLIAHKGNGKYFNFKEDFKVLFKSINKNFDFTYTEERYYLSKWLYLATLILIIIKICFG